jgi:uncharacterized membrane protein
MIFGLLCFLNLFGATWIYLNESYELIGDYQAIDWKNYLVGIVRYECVDENEFEQIGDDPQLLFDFSNLSLNNGKIYGVKIQLNDRADAQFFWGRDSADYCEEKSKMVYNTKECVLILDENFTYLRIDIDDDFIIEDFQVAVGYNSVKIGALYKYIIMILLNIYIVVILVLIKKKANFYVQFLVIALNWGLIFSFVIIPWQTPDEYTHLRMIGDEFNNSTMASELLESMDLRMREIQFNWYSKVSSEEFIEAVNNGLDYMKEDCLPKGIKIEAVRHLPASLGIYFGIIIGLPVYWILQLGELCSLVFYVMVCIIALKLMPFKKELLEAIMLLPMCIQQAASISYDSVLLPLCFLFIAYIIHLKCSTEKVRFQSVLKIIGLLVIITIIKLPYFVIGLLILTIPLSKFEFKFCNRRISETEIKKMLPLMVFILAITICMGFYLVRDNSYIQVLIASVLQWKRTLYLIKETISNRGEYLAVSLVGNFGWVDTPMPIFFVTFTIIWVIIVSLTKVGSENGNSIIWRKWDIFVYYLSSALLTYIISISMVRHTLGILYYGTEDFTEIVNYQEELYKIPYILGLQGRYYVPVIVLWLVPISNIFNINEIKYKYLSRIIYIYMMIYTTIKIYERYFII